MHAAIKIFCIPDAAFALHSNRVGTAVGGPVYTGSYGQVV